MKRTLLSVFGLSIALACGAIFGALMQRSHFARQQGRPLTGQTNLSPAANSSGTSASTTAGEPTIPPRLQGRLKLYVLVGQSNIAGRADIPTDIQPSANIFLFGNDYRWKTAQPPLDSSVNQVDLISADTEAGFGPAFTFAQTLISQNNNQIIGLIPCAKADSSITDWGKSPSDETLYGSCLKRIRAASPMGTVSGILFFQGEADAVDAAQFPNLTPDASAWAEKFATFAYNFRADIGNPTIPLVFAQLGQPDSFENLPNWNEIQQQQEQIQIPNGAMIATKDLPMDGIHFTADSYKVIGQRFADTMTLLQNAIGTAGEGALPNTATQ
ncbi:MAG: sialate O-acetylesterase [Cyanobacteria bacterium J06626_6]